MNNSKEELRGLGLEMEAMNALYPTLSFYHSFNIDLPTEDRYLAPGFAITHGGYIARSHSTFGISDDQIQMLNNV